MYQVMEDEYLAKGLTETALTTPLVVLNKNFCSVHIRKRDNNYYTGPPGSMTIQGTK